MVGPSSNPGRRLLPWVEWRLTTDARAVDVCLWTPPSTTASSITSPASAASAASAHPIASTGPQMPSSPQAGTGRVDLAPTPVAVEAEAAAAGFTATYAVATSGSRGVTVRWLPSWVSDGFGPALGRAPGPNSAPMLPNPRPDGPRPDGRRPDGQRPDSRRPDDDDPRDVPPPVALLPTTSVVLVRFGLRPGAAPELMAATLNSQVRASRVVWTRNRSEPLFASIVYA